VVRVLRRDVADRRPVVLRAVVRRALVLRALVLRPAVVRLLVLPVVLRRGAVFVPPPLLLEVAISTPFSDSLKVSNTRLYPSAEAPLQALNPFYPLLNSRGGAVQPGLGIVQLT
jgi:hypothetical protein